jgi:hypothetical protein
MVLHLPVYRSRKEQERTDEEITMEFGHAMREDPEEITDDAI